MLVLHEFKAYILSAILSSIWHSAMAYISPRPGIEGHSHCANINFINLCLLCLDCLHLLRRSKSSKVSQRSAKDGKDQKQCHGCHGLLIFVKTPFSLNDGYPSMSESFYLSLNLSSKSCKSRVTRL